MSATTPRTYSIICPVNPPGHDWDNGLSCYWCQTTRTPREAILSQLESRRGGTREDALALLDAYDSAATPPPVSPVSTPSPSLHIAGSPLTALRALRDAARHTPGSPYAITITAMIPPGRHPLVSGEVTGRLAAMGSLLTIHHAPTLRMIEDIRPEWVTSVEII